MNTKIQEVLTGGVPVWTDGAWGTQLQDRGLPPGGCPEIWNLEHPDRVEEVARAYVDAGSRIILTNSFGGNRIILDRHDQGENAAEINRRAAEISKRSAGDKAFVFASIGPSGKILMMGEVTEDELQAAFEEQATALAEGGADGLVVETMTDTEEAAIAVRAAVATGLPVVGCMSFDSGTDNDRTMMGTTVAQAAEALAEAGADVVGANCGQEIDGYLTICEQFRAATDLPIWLKPNAGMPEIVEGETVFKTAPEAFASKVPGLVEAGASFIGGCCGSGPEFIQLLSETL
jgi:methionine synthase I (cobalamin-dependent)